MPIDGSGESLAQDATLQEILLALGGGPIPQGGSGTGLAQDATLQLILAAIGGGGGGSLDGEQSIVLANGLNSNISLAKEVAIDATGPTAATSIGGFDPPTPAVGGQRYTLVFDANQPLTIVHEDLNSAPANRFDTLTGLPITLPPRRVSVSFVFNARAALGVGRWVVQNIGTLLPARVSVKDKGAKGDGQHVFNASITSGNNFVTDPSNPFTALDVGKLYSIYGAGVAGAVLTGTITGFVNPGEVTLSVAASTSVIGTATMYWATDDYAAIIAACTTAVAAAVAGFAMSAEVYFPPGEYGSSQLLDIDTTYNGLHFRGASSGIVGIDITVRSRIRLFTAQAALVQNTSQGTRWSDLWFAGNRLATDVMEFAYFAVNQTFDRCKFDGPTAAGSAHHYSNRNGQLEIDFITFRDCFFAGDFFDGSYFGGNGIFNENAEAFKINYYDIRVSNFNFNFNYIRGSCNVHSFQAFSWLTACILIQTYCEDVIFEDGYTEGDSGTFLEQTALFPVTSSTCFTLRDVEINSSAACIWRNVMQLKLENLQTGGNFFLDPISATFDGVQYGVQSIKSDNTTFYLGSSFVYTSGVPGQLVEEVTPTTYAALPPTVVNDGAMGGGSPNLACAISTPFLSAAWNVGQPCSVAGAGPAGATLNSFIKTFTNKSHVVLTDNATTPVVNATVTFGQTVLEDARLNSPSQVVGSTGYDADGVVLGCAIAVTDPSVPLIPADIHVIGTLTNDRSYTLSNIGILTIDPGKKLRVIHQTAADAHTATINYNISVPASIGLIAGQWADFSWLPNTGWTLVATGSITQQEVVQTTTFFKEYDNGNSGAGPVTINWNNGQKQLLTLTGSPTIVFTPPTQGVGNFQLRIVQGAGGSHTITWPTEGLGAGDVAWVGSAAPTLSTSAGANDIVSVYWNGTQYFASYGLNFG